MENTSMETNLNLIVEDFIALLGGKVEVRRIERKIDIVWGEKEYVVVCGLKEESGSGMSDEMAELRIYFMSSMPIDREYSLKHPDDPDTKRLNVYIDALFYSAGFEKLPGDEHLKSEFGLQESDTIHVRRSINSPGRLSIAVETGFEYDGVGVLEDFDLAVETTYDILSKMRRMKEEAVYS